MTSISSSPRVVAVLGPTNTGKTHYAMERMLGHASGMIGFPLRLLARENYDRAVRLRGRGQVALITGEEKIVPATARYFLCTVEAMPLDRSVAFLAVDEVQMGADADRGHVFTDRLLHARGSVETMFMGAETARPLIRRLVPGVQFMSRPRFSTLAYTGPRKITRLPARSAVIAFSTADVYALAEMLRRHRGGAAVVLGALSPRTRNAQVALYQAGEVDYLVATDAIGMGLNMDIEHVAFAQLRKFDGRLPRALTPPELAQIAGRAGRHMNDGTFGTTGEAPPLEPEVAEAIESHRFEQLRFLYWRNARLRFTSLAALQTSLAQPPQVPGLVRAREADDELALAQLAAEPGIRDIARHPDRLRLLWEVCQIPDFGKVLSDAHARRLGRIYRALAQPPHRLPTDWLAANVKRLARTDGDIEALAQRIANVRIWTYVAYRRDWVEDAPHWQERTRAVENQLSDALHERLTQRFVDRRTAVLVRRMKDRGPLAATVGDDDTVWVEGEFLGRLEGFRFVADESDADPAARRAMTNAALRALRGEARARLDRLETEPDEAFALDARGRILWHDQPLARLAAGADILAPRVETLASDLLEPAQNDRLRVRLERWLGAELRRRLGPLMAAREAPLEGAARGLVFQLAEALGSLPRARAEAQIKALGRRDRQTLRMLNVRLGRESVFLPALLKPAAVRLRVLLWTAACGLPVPPAAVPAERVSFPLAEDVPAGFYEAAGYRPAGRLAVRADGLERLAARAWALSRKGPFTPGPDLLTLAGCGAEDMAAILRLLGFHRRRGKEGTDLFAATSKGRRHSSRPKDGTPGRQGPREESPFAKLRALTEAS